MTQIQIESHFLIDTGSIMGLGSSQVDPYQHGICSAYRPGVSMIPQALDPLELEVAKALHGKIPRRFTDDGLAAIRDQIGNCDEDIDLLDDLLENRDNMIYKAFDAYYDAYVACCKYIGVNYRDKPDDWSQTDSIAFHNKLIAMNNDIYGRSGPIWRSLHVYTGFEWIDHDGSAFSFDVPFIIGNYGREYRTMYLRIIAKYIIKAYESIFVPVVHV